MGTKQLLSKKEFIITNFGIESYYWAFLQKDGNIDITPTVLFAKMCKADRKRSWSRTTLKSYAQIIEMFFRTMRQHGSTIQTITTKETQGFMQAYYMKSLPFQEKTGKPSSESRMEAIHTVLVDLVEKSVQFGFRENKKLSFKYQEAPGSVAKLDEVDKIHQCYIPPELFEKLLKHLEVKSTFERDRDEIALRIGYEMGMRTEELVRGDNFSTKKLNKARLTWKLGEVIEWDNLIGKGSKGGKARNVIIKPKLVERIFKFMDDYKSEYEHCEHLFCHASGKKLSAKHGTNTFYAAKNNFNHPEINGKSFQKLRHSYATNLAMWCIKNKINKRLIQDRLGHSDFYTTKIYIEVSHLINGDIKKAEEMRMVRLDKRTKNTIKRKC